MSEQISQQVTNDKNFKLVEYMKYDTTLGRDMNIEIGKASSLGAAESMNIKGGVKLTCFAH
jgi:hypothetical protein